MSYKKLFDDVTSAKMSGNAKLLYTALLDKYELSIKKGFLNASGEVICKMKCSEIMELLTVSRATALRLVNELKQKGLINYKLGLCKMYEFQVFQMSQNDTFKSIKNEHLKVSKCDFQMSQNETSLTYKPNHKARLTKPNARAYARTREEFLGDENVSDEILKNSQSEVLENSASLKNSQSQKSESLENSNAKKSSKAFLQMCDKPEFISTECWNDFITYKKQRNERYTDIGKSKFLSHLAQIQANTNACEEALNESIANNWRGVFEPKPRKIKTSVSPNQITNALLDWLSDNDAIDVQCEEALPSNITKGA